MNLHLKTPNHTANEIFKFSEKRLSSVKARDNTQKTFENTELSTYQKNIQQYNKVNRKLKNLSTIVKPDVNLRYDTKASPSTRLSPANRSTGGDYLSFYDSNMSTISNFNAGGRLIPMWDAMSIHDVHNFQKEQKLKYMINKDKQSQLKQFLDKQVNDSKTRKNIEKLQDSNEYN